MSEVLTGPEVGPFRLSDELEELRTEARRQTKLVRERISEMADLNFARVFAAFRKARLYESDLAGSTGYGYSDPGREALDRLVAEIFGAERAAVRAQWISGTHAIACGLRGNLSPGKTLLSATGAPYDTLAPVIGHPQSYAGSLAEWGVGYRQLELRQGRIDLEALTEAIDERVGVVFLQRSRGYTPRRSLPVQELGEAVRAVRAAPGGADVTILVDNCYGEMVEELEPSHVGADLVVGSLIKNPGATVVSTGAYVAGSEKAVEGALTAFTAPGLAGHVGPSLGLARGMAQAWSMAPQTVAQSLEGLVVASWLFEQAGFEVSPRWNESRTDTISSVTLGSVEAQRAFCKAVQGAGLVDASAVPESVVQPGYRDPILMAGGTFIQGSSAELSADGPERPPYICYLQGGTARWHVETAALLALEACRKIRP